MSNVFDYKLWAKKPQFGSSPDDLHWLPLTAHMADAAEAAKKLWDDWLADGIKRQIANGILNDPEATIETARPFFVFLAAAHDVGKTCPVFQLLTGKLISELDSELRQYIINAKLPVEGKFKWRAETHHSLISHVILSRNGFDDSVCVILGGHHGTPPCDEKLNNLEGYEDESGFNKPQWIQAQDEHLFYALSLSDLTKEAAVSIRLSRPAQVLLSGLVILTDWISSDTDLFPLLPLEYYKRNSIKQAEAAFEKLKLTEYWKPIQDWEDIFLLRFGREKERPIQSVAKKTALKCYKPGIMVIEAPMGEGKTEAALAVAEIWANRSERRGIYFALPTQATSNAMFKRVKEWICMLDSGEGKYSIRLSHGKADLNDTYCAIPLSSNTQVDENDDCVIIHEWLSGRKKGMLADFVIGTVDHVLMAALKQKHLVLRHLGLASKVIIIDEVHAYDIYMNSYLLKALQWLGAYDVPVVVLSATLPSARRRELIGAYLSTKKPQPDVSANLWADKLEYPLVTYTDNATVWQESVQGTSKNLTVELKPISDGALLEALDTVLTDGGYAGIICNTVKRAQKMYILLSVAFGEEYVCLLHARFLAKDRLEKEKKLTEILGPSNKNKRTEKLIVIGTQVMEQSLDFDFDIIATDLCPMDLLLQRIGRLHRHDRPRPERLFQAVCMIMGMEDNALEIGSEAVYGAYLLLRTRALLMSLKQVSLPNDIPGLVAGVYCESDADVTRALQEAWKADMEKRKRKAKTFQIGSPGGQTTLINWLNTTLRDDSEKRGEAAVRDGADSVEILVLRCEAGELKLLPWIENGRTVPRTTPDDNLARIIAACSVRLPSLFGGKWIIDKVIGELENAMIKEGMKDRWSNTPILKGSLCLILDETMETKLCGYPLKYSKSLGLIHEEEV